MIRGRVPPEWSLGSLNVPPTPANVLLLRRSPHHITADEQPQQPTLQKRRERFSDFLIKGPYRFLVHAFPRETIARVNGVNILFPRLNEWDRMGTNAFLFLEEVTLLQFLNEVVWAI